SADGLRRSAAEREAALCAGWLNVVDVLLLDLGSEAQVVLAVNPAQVHQFPILPVVSIIGIAAARGVGGAECRVVGHDEPGPAALITIRPIRAGDAQLPAQILTGDIRLRLSVVVLPGEVAVEDQFWTDQIGSASRQAVGRADADSRIAALIVDID